MSALLDPTYLRRYFVLDQSLVPVLAGDVPERLTPTCETLAAAVVDEVRRLIVEHDFERSPIATGLVDVRYALRVTRLMGATGPSYGVAIDRMTLAAPLRVATTRHGLAPIETEMLRLIAGGYDRRAMATRLDMPLGATRDLVHTLRTKLGCQTRTDFIALLDECRANRPVAPRRQAQRAQHA